MIPKTHTYKYTLVNYDLGLNYPYQEIFQRTLTLKQELLRLITSPKINSLKGPFSAIPTRIKDLCSFLEARLNLLSKDTNPQNLPDKELPKQFPIEKTQAWSITGTSALLDKLQIPPIISEIITVLKKYYIFTTGDEKRDIILSWFFLGTSVTQNFLSSVLDISQSTVSRHLQVLVDQKYIEIKEKRWNGKRLYCLSPFSLPNKPYSARFAEELSIWLKTFKKLLIELENPQNNWLKIRGFPWLHSILCRLIREIENKNK
ncbi:MAG: ArsR/SmtB family transcription factor [Promethearchaeota archaeon]